jgi:hypothetical protein
MKKPAIIIIGLIVFVLLILFLLQQRSLQIVSSTPVSGATEVDLSGPITIILNRSINPEYFAFESVPKINAAISHNKKTIIIAPSLQLIPDTSYRLTLLYNQQPIGEVVFTTRSLTQPEFIEIIREQVYDDWQFSKAQEQALQERPFLSKLPIETETFRAIFDHNRSKIRIRILIETSSDQQKEEVLNQALDYLNQSGIDVGNIGYYLIDNQP